MSSTLSFLDTGKRRVNISKLTVIPILLLLAQIALCADFDFVVAPNGNDAWNGTLESANAEKSNGPFATPERARQAVRQLKASQADRHGAITVLLRGGTYFLKEPLSLSAEDSGTENVPVVYAAWPGEKPVLSGGQRLSGFTRTENGRWQLHIPEVERGDWMFSQLFVNGARRYRPRLPKDSYYFIAGQASRTPAANDTGPDRFRFNAGELNGDWKNLNDVEVLAFHNWNMSRLRVASIDPASRIVAFTGPTCSKDDWAGLNKGGRYIVENVAEALQAPGEWYLERKTGILTYIPLPGEDPAKEEVIAPRLEKLAQLKGDVGKKQWVAHLVFRGLTFSHTNWTLPAAGYSFGQAEAGLHAAVNAEGARDCALVDCRVIHTGTYAIEWGRGCKGNLVENCELTDLGAGGVKIGEMQIRGKDEEATGGQSVKNCLIASGGRMHPAAIGIWIGQSANNNIEHNDIFDFYYTGISAGWTWGYGPSGAHDNIFAYNHIHTIGQGVLTDMGTIYTLGISPGTVLRYNLMHDVESHSYGGWGIYFDEGSTDILAENNIVYNTKTGGFHQHYGKNNRLINNIFAFAKEAQLMRTRVEDHLSFTMERNIVYWKEGPLLGSNWSGDKYALDYNDYWQVGTAAPHFNKLSLDEWQKKGKDVHSIVADPLFVDPDKYDFALKPDSPVLKLGFQPIDTSKIGRQGNGHALNVFAALPPRAFPGPPPPPEPQPITEDFEQTPVGGKVTDAITNEENTSATVRVTDETAASGKHSLKFVDGPGQKASWNPHIYYEPKFIEGITQEHFSLRMEPGAILSHEWRTAGNPYHTGPSILVQADGTVTANGQKLTKIPQGQWVKFEVTCGLGSASKAKYELNVTSPGAETQHFHDISFDREFKSLFWLGFVSAATEKTVFYLDDVELKRLP